ncbi:hypothetical protein T484DRAFT_1636617, partial [Baffinella frigidus]
PEPESRNPAPGTRNPEPETRNPKPGARNPEPGTRTPEPRTRNPEPESRNPEPGTRDPKPKTPSAKWHPATFKRDHNPVVQRLQFPQPTQRATTGVSGTQCPSFRYLIRRNPPMPLRVAYRRIVGVIA